jgi:hypothetical protein
MPRRFTTGNEGCRLIRPALAWRLIASRTPTPALLCARPTVPDPGQEITSNVAKQRKIRFLRAQL